MPDSFLETAGTVSYVRFAASLYRDHPFYEPAEQVAMVQRMLASTSLERQAMDGWQNGDPDPQLAISDPQITYIHAVVEKRLEGLPALKELYEQYRGMPLFDSYEILNPKVQATGDVAVLTYELLRRNGSATTYWNATQVYCRKKEGWRVIHTHWSTVKEQQR